MAIKSANVIARVEPDVKVKAEMILSKIGIPVSTLINALYRQIIYTEGIPFPLVIPKGVQSLDTMTDEEFEQMIDASIEQSKNGNTTPADEVITALKDKYK